MRGETLMKCCLIVLVALSLGACCCFGGELGDGREIYLEASARWAGEVPPIGSSATVDFYVMVEGVGNWLPAVDGTDVPYPVDGTGALVDTFKFPYGVPASGERVTYRYELDLTVGGTTYTAADYPSLACESGEWWWYFAGRLYCSESPR
jgi:hypothetical protein